MKRLTLSARAAAVAMALAATASAPAADYTWTAASGLLPSQAGDISRVQVGHTYDELVPGGPLRLVSTAHLSGWMAYIATGPQLEMPDRPELSFTMRVAEQILTDPVSVPMRLSLGTGSGIGVSFQFTPTAVQLLHADGSGVKQSFALDTTQFHDYRLELTGPQNGAPLNLFVDGVARIHDHLGAGPPLHTLDKFLLFGDLAQLGGGVTEWQSIEHNMAAVPEPATWALLGLGLAAIARRRAAAAEPSLLPD